VKLRGERHSTRQKKLLGIKWTISFAIDFPSGSFETCATRLPSIRNTSQVGVPAAIDFVIKRSKSRVSETGADDD